MCRALLAIATAFTLGGSALQAQAPLRPPDPWPSYGHGSIVAPDTLVRPSLWIRLARTQAPVAQEPDPRAPGWAKVLGGLVTGTATLVGLFAMDEDDLSPVGGYALHALGTAAGTGVATLFWETPRPGILLGPAVGAAPTIAGLAIEDDSTAGLFLTVAWIGAPIGASIGQR